MKKHTDPIRCSQFYHIFNRGINGCDIFIEHRNYSHFLRKYAEFIEPVAETYAYCLLKNHFHILVKIRSPEQILQNIKALKKRKKVSKGNSINNVSEVQNLADVIDTITLTDPEELHALAVKHVSNQFAKLFNSYAQSINKAYHRTGSLFENTFRRILVDNEAYFRDLVYYIHANPQKHGFLPDFRDYPYSSYHTHLSKLDTKLLRTELLGWFGDKDGYEKYHLSDQILNNLDKFEIEFD